MQMQHPDSKEPIEVHPSQIDNMKARGFVEVKTVKPQEKK